MPLNSNSIKYVIGNSDTIQNMKNIPAFIPFSDEVIDYLNKVSKLIFANSEAKQYPDVLTFAFWCRKASLRDLQKPYEDAINRIGKGVVFHIAPSNVAVNFAYSLVAGMLSGNANIVRLPSKHFEQVNIICKALFEALDSIIKQYISLIRYNHDKEITDSLSILCDARIIWGGDETISSIRKSPLGPRATDITFADRYSICIINADSYFEEKDKKKIALGFYNDTYLTDQNACTSPRLVVWMGEKIKEAQKDFWGELHDLVKEKYLLQPVQTINKYTNLCKQAISEKSVHLNSGKDNYIVRINIELISERLMDHKCNSGYFMEYEAKLLDELLPLLTPHCQTVSYYGIGSEEIRNFILTTRPRGVDRVVPIGKTMDFSLIWDGYDLIRCLSREISFI